MNCAFSQIAVYVPSVSGSWVHSLDGHLSQGCQTPELAGACSCRSAQSLWLWKVLMTTLNHPWISPYIYLYVSMLYIVLIYLIVFFSIIIISSIIISIIIVSIIITVISIISIIIIIHVRAYDTSLIVVRRCSWQGRRTCLTSALDTTAHPSSSLAPHSTQPA